MSETIEYIIKFYSCWHCGSGLGAGARFDAVVIKDADGLPFVPGRTIKGLLREQLEEYSMLAQTQIDEMFGSRGVDGEECERKAGVCFFSNACLSDEERSAITQDEGLKRHLYTTLAFTAIDDATGVAKDSSLRTIEAAVPCTLHGIIENVDEDSLTEVKDGLMMIKRLGTHRSRGLGRCDFIIRKP